MIGYYYCSLGTFLNILKNKEIYLSDPLKMNDSLEISWYLSRLNDNKGEDTESIWERMKMRSGLDFSFSDLLNNLKTKGQRSIYISCFSEEPDLLSQWRAYADDGKGVSIGFDLYKLGKPSNFLVEKIIYTNDIVENERETDVECVADTIGTVICENNISDKREQIDVFLHELIPLLAKYKNPAFKEEKEVRLIYCDDMKFEKIIDQYGAFQEKWEERQLTHDFRTIRNSDITEFVRLKFDPECVVKIYIGPKCELRENDVLAISKTFLNSEPDISVSKSSYR